MSVTALDRPEVDFDLSNVRQLGNDLLARIDAMREVDPVYWSEKNQVWMVTGHKELHDGFMGRYPLSNFRSPGPALGLLSEEEKASHAAHFTQTAKHWLFNMDPPDHTRLRSLMGRAFSKKVVDAVRPHAQQFVRETLDSVAGKGEIDFVTEVARKIPARTIMLLVGLDDSFFPKLHRWSLVLNTSGNVNLSMAQVDQLEALFSEMREAFLPEIERRRANPTDDFLSALVTAEIDGEKLSEEDLLATCNLVLIAGHDTTANTMGLAAAALARDPAACDYLRSRPANMVDAVMELSRYVAMSTVNSRRVLEDFEWNGHQLKAGQYVMMFMAGGNRDPKAFPHPDKLDFSRSQAENMTFAPGIHHCIGHLLAKMQLAEFLPELVTRFDLELLDDELHFGDALGFRGLERLPMRLIPR